MGGNGTQMRASATRFGHSLPGKAAHKLFGYEVSKLTTKVARYLKRLQEDELLHGEVVNL